MIARPFGLSFSWVDQRWRSTHSQLTTTTPASWPMSRSSRPAAPLTKVWNSLGWPGRPMIESILSSLCAPSTVTKPGNGRHGMTGFE